LHLNDGVIDGKRLISSENLRETHTPQMVIRNEGRWRLFFPESETSQLSYGLGWFISDYRGHKMVMHGGTIDGFRACVMLVPKSKIGIAVLVNLTGSQMPEAACYNIVDFLLGLPKKDWNAYISEEARNFEAAQARGMSARSGKRHANTKGGPRSCSTATNSSFSGATSKAGSIISTTTPSPRLKARWRPSRRSLRWERTGK
jgi:CubicO group peptidase (beta-lactamase class C family)